MLTFYLCTAGTTAAASGVSLHLGNVTSTGSMDRAASWRSGLLCLSLTSSFANGISLAAIFLTAHSSEIMLNGL